MRAFHLILLFTAISQLVFGQELLVSPYAGPSNLIKVSSDKSTYWLHDTIRFTIIVSSEMDKFIPPLFENFNIVSGPDTDDQFENAHKAIVQRENPNKMVFKLSYLLTPLRRGSFVLPCPNIDLNGTPIACETVTIKVVEGTYSEEQLKKYELEKFIANTNHEEGSRRITFKDDKGFLEIYTINKWEVIRPLTIEELILIEKIK